MDLLIIYYTLNKKNKWFSTVFLFALPPVSLTPAAKGFFCFCICWNAKTYLKAFIFLIQSILLYWVRKITSSKQVPTGSNGCQRVPTGPNVSQRVPTCPNRSHTEVCFMFLDFFAKKKNDKIQLKIIYFSYSKYIIIIFLIQSIVYY